MNTDQRNLIPSDLIRMDLSSNQLTTLPDEIGDLVELHELNIQNNHLSSLPKTIINLPDLRHIVLHDNPLQDLSILQNIPNLKNVLFLNVVLPRRYWTKMDEWKAEWLLDEINVEIRRAAIEKIGYEKICNELNPLTIDNWREYTLLRIEGGETIDRGWWVDIGWEPMVLLKMTCPSTNHIHILRVPPEVMSAEAAITWINHGIHPDDIAIQT